MKKIKINLSKTGWIILSVGVFIVVLAGLGVTYSQQLKTSSEASDELEVTKMRLGQFNIEELESQKASLQELHTELSLQHDTGKTLLLQPVTSIDVTDKCYEIAAENNVEIIDIGTTDVKTDTFIKLPCEMISVNIVVRGELSDMVDFIINLNEDFSTGYIVTVQTVMADTPYTSVQLVVYTYKGD